MKKNRLICFQLFFTLALILFLHSARAVEIWDTPIIYRGAILKEDPFTVDEGKFISPNEQENYLQLRCLSSREKGALISVGTFRVPNVGAAGEYESIFQVDNDLTTNFFNHLSKELIRISIDRYEYLSYLFTGEKQRFFIEQVRARKITDLQYLISLENLAEVMPEGKYYFNLSQLNLKLPKLSEEYRKIIHSKFNHYPRPIYQNEKNPSGILNYLFSRKPFLNQDSLGHLKTFYLFFEGSETSTFFGNPKLFRHVQELIESGNFVVLSADLLGDIALSHLSSVLKVKNQTLKTFDSSNILSWIAEKTPEKVRDFFTLLEHRFLWSEQGRAFLTDEWRDSTQAISIEEGDPPQFTFTEPWRQRILEASYVITHWKYFVFDHQSLGQIHRAFDPSHHGRWGLSSMMISGRPLDQRANRLFYYPQGICR